MKKTKLWGITLLTLGLFLMGSSCQSKPKTENDLIGGEKDEYGCLVSAGYQWCADQQKCLRTFEELCADEVIEIVQNLNAETGVELLSEKDGEFMWIREDSNLVIPSIVFAQKGLMYEDYQEVHAFLSENMEINIHNQADGVEGSINGYLFRYMACQSSFYYQNMKEDENGVLQPESEEIDIIFQCGFYNENLK
jgi:hypothetical protein